MLRPFLAILIVSVAAGRISRDVLNTSDSDCLRLSVFVFMVASPSFLAPVAPTKHLLWNPWLRQNRIENPLTECPSGSCKSLKRRPQKRPGNRVFAWYEWYSPNLPDASLNSSGEQHLKINLTACQEPVIKNLDVTENLLDGRSCKAARSFAPDASNVARRRQGRRTKADRGWWNDGSALDAG
jgi:hypothetical protein